MSHGKKTCNGVHIFQEHKERQDAVDSDRDATLTSLFDDFSSGNTPGELAHDHTDVVQMVASWGNLGMRHAPADPFKLDISVRLCSHDSACWRN